ncbi:hypothetical protein GCM10023200_58480 [Actinomycetospora chlora]|uniref:Uncharacterized protein n=1 Tax=Actinomycetospora chlora TaxID=663608 RepID=A0ABP9CLW2_9PSEU
MQPGDEGTQGVLVGRREPERLPDHRVEGHLVGVVADQEVDVDGRAVGDGLDRLAVEQVAVEDGPERREAHERVAQPLDGEVRRPPPQAGDGGDQALVGHVDEGVLVDAQVVGQRRRRHRGLGRREDVGAAAALHDRPADQPGRGGDQQGGDAQRAGGLAEHRDAVRVPAEGHGVVVDPAQGGDLVVQPPVGDDARDGPEAGDAEPVVDRDDDGALPRQARPVVDGGERGAAGERAAVDEHHDRQPGAARGADVRGQVVRARHPPRPGDRADVGHPRGGARLWRRGTGDGGVALTVPARGLGAGEAPLPHRCRGVGHAEEGRDGVRTVGDGAPDRPAGGLPDLVHAAGCPLRHSSMSSTSGRSGAIGGRSSIESRPRRSRKSSVVR